MNAQTFPVLCISGDGKSRNLEQLTLEQFIEIRDSGEWWTQCRLFPDGTEQWVAMYKTERPKKVKKDAN